MRKLDDRVDLQVSMLLAVFVAVVALTCFGVSYSVTYHDMKVSLRERVEYILEHLESRLDLSAFPDIETREDIRKEESKLINNLTVIPLKNVQAKVDYLHNKSINVYDAPYGNKVAEIPNGETITLIGKLNDNDEITWYQVGRKKYITSNICYSNTCTNSTYINPNKRK